MTQLAVRLDESTSTALNRLVSQTGQTRSEVVREAVAALDRARVLAQMREESLAVARDEADRAETHVVFDDMRARRAW
ncbi:MAG: ribbon-helix-helix protein, CopG family [Propionibacteriaceae bacterium]|nr:ribbon-helix-helix protein, CopG family [Propionibacteriaceae bacterium]